MWEQLAEWDRKLFVFLNNLGVDDYDNFWIFITQINHWIPLYLIFFGLFFYSFSWKKAILSILFTLISLAAVVSFTQFVKIQVARLRPNNEPLLEDLIRVLQKPTNFSFFSGHAASSFAVTTFVVLVLRKKHPWVFAFYIWPVLFAMSRIFVGVHYPSDILVGAGVGVSMASLFYYFYKKTCLKLNYI
ncbi:MAG: phosphatase PAP2 family protein [Cytophagaceae bacterium]|nr:phosphatase PAP2 family protein [Cytophagaceae bacterium]|tara:strand:+ start:6203 stop:6766 length:564 start_codon:yes stop_codon:yes gene_type:complete